MGSAPILRHFFDRGGIQKIIDYKLKTRKAVEAACEEVLAKHPSASFLNYTITTESETTYHNSKRGRPAAGSEPKAVVTRKYKVPPFSKSEMQDLSMRPPLRKRTAGPILDCGLAFSGSLAMLPGRKKLSAVNYGTIISAVDHCQTF